MDFVDGFKLDGTMSDRFSRFGFCVDAMDRPSKKIEDEKNNNKNQPRRRQVCCW